MNVSDVNKVAVNYTAQAPAKVQSAKETERTEDAEQKKNTVRQDQFVESTETKTVTYSKTANKKITADQMMDMQRQRLDSFSKMLYSMITKQGQKANLSIFGLNLTTSNADRTAAAASIAPGGEYSVDAVADRILSMAKALAGDDASKIGELRTAVQKGFKAAGVDLGGKLPAICNDTYNKVMQGFDDWEKSFSPAE